MASAIQQFVSYHVHSSHLCCRRSGELLRYRGCLGVRTNPLTTTHSRLHLPNYRRLFAKAGYNIALISRESETLHKFAAELKSIGDTDVRSPFFCRGPPNHALIPNPGSGFPNIRLQLQRSPNRLPRRTRLLAPSRRARRALQRRLRRLETLPTNHRGRNRPHHGHEHQSGLCVRPRGDRLFPRSGHPRR
jgi:hypothetical protein